VQHGFGEHRAVGGEVVVDAAGLKALLGAAGLVGVGRDDDADVAFEVRGGDRVLDALDVRHVAQIAEAGERREDDGALRLHLQDGAVGVLAREHDALAASQRQGHLAVGGGDVGDVGGLVDDRALRRPGGHAGAAGDGMRRRCSRRRGGGRFGRGGGWQRHRLLLLRRAGGFGFLPQLHGRLERRTVAQIARLAVVGGDADRSVHPRRDQQPVAAARHLRR
jgi:hypothetical protein